MQTHVRLHVFAQTLCIGPLYVDSYKEKTPCLPILTSSQTPRSRAQQPTPTSCTVTWLFKFWSNLYTVNSVRVCQDRQEAASQGPVPNYNQLLIDDNYWRQTWRHVMMIEVLKGWHCWDPDVIQKCMTPLSDVLLQTNQLVSSSISLDVSFCTLPSTLFPGKERILNKKSELIALHKERHCFAISLTVCKISGIGKRTQNIHEHHQTISFSWIPSLPHRYPLFPIET